MPAVRLGRALGTIYNHSVDLEDYDLNIVRQLEFAQCMFEAMNDATTKAGKYDSWGEPYLNLVLGLIEVNVAVFALCNSSGLLYRSMMKHEEKLNRYQAQIPWADGFGRSKPVPGAIIRLHDGENCGRTRD